MSCKTRYVWDKIRASKTCAPDLKKKNCRTFPWQKHCTQEGRQVNYVRHDKINETDDRNDHQPLAQSQNYWKTVNWSWRQQVFQNYSAACKIASSGKHSGSVRTIQFLSSNHFGENHPKSLDRALQKRLPGKKYSLKKRLSEIKFHDRETTFQQRNKYASVNYHSLLYKIKCRPTLSSLKEIIKGRCHFIQNKQHLKELFRTGIL